MIRVQPTAALGFTHGRSVAFELQDETRVGIRSVNRIAKHHVSFQRRASGQRPVIDIANPLILSIAAPGQELRITLRHNQIPPTVNPRSRL